MASKKFKSSNKNQNVALNNLHHNILNIIGEINDPEGSTLRTIAKNLMLKGIHLLEEDIKINLNFLVSAEKLSKPNESRWKSNQTHLNILQTEPENTSLFGLPRDIATEVLSNLPLKDLFRIKRVCKGWLDLTNSRKLWKSIDTFKMESHEIPNTIIDTISKMIPENHLETFRCDDKMIFMSKEAIKFGDLVTFVLTKNFHSLKEIELVISFPIEGLLNRILMCKSITMLGIKGPLYESDALNIINKQLSNLKELKASIFPLYCTGSERKILIEWSQNLEVLDLESVISMSFEMKVPSHGLSKFSLTSRNGLHSTKATIVNWKDLFTHKLNHINLIECSHVNEEMITYMEANARNVKNASFIVGASNFLASQKPYKTVFINLPYLETLKLISGYLCFDIDTPNLRELSIINTRREVRYRINAPKLNSIIATGDGIWKFTSISEMKHLEQATFPSIETKDTIFPWEKLTRLTIERNFGLTDYCNQYKSLKYLNLDCDSVDLDIDLPKLESLRIRADMKQSFNQITLKTSSLTTLVILARNTVGTICSIKLLDPLPISFDYLESMMLNLDCISILRPKRICIKDREISKEIDNICSIPLHSIDFIDCKDINDNVLIKLANSCKSELQSICIPRDSNVTDKGLQFISKVCNNLSCISLNRIDTISEKGILSIIKNCKYLDKLSIFSCSNISKDSSIFKAWSNPRWKLYIDYRRIY